MDGIYHEGEKIRDSYKFEDELGRGSFSIVKKAVHRLSGKQYAVKIINRNSFEDDEESAL